VDDEEEEEEEGGDGEAVLLPLSVLGPKAVGFTVRADRYQPWLIYRFLDWQLL